MAKIKKLLQSVQEIERLIIMPHNNPDPDAIASTVALRYLLDTQAAVAGCVVYQGIIGRAENRTLAQYLSFPLEPVSDEDFPAGQPLAFVDTQPGAGNISAPDPFHPVISFEAALRTARIYSGLVISYLGIMQYPDLVAEIADLLLRLENARWVVCMGLYKETLPSVQVKAE